MANIFPSDKKKDVHPAVFTLWILVLAYFIITFSCLYQRYTNFQIRIPHDSAAMIQVSWSIVKGVPFTVSVPEYGEEHSAWFKYHGVGKGPHNMLGTQLMLSLAFFSPIFFFTSSAMPFLIIQALIVSLAAIPLYSFADQKLKNKWLALLIAAAYLLNPATYTSFEKFGFRVETLFIPAFFSMFYFLERKKIQYAVISMLIALLTKHNIIPIVFMLGLYFLIIDRKHQRFGVYCLAAAVIYYLIAVKLIFNHFQTYKAASFYHFADFGDSPGAVFINMMSHPEKIIAAISPKEWGNMFHILFPTGFLALLHPVFWACLPQLILNAVLKDYHSIYGAWHWAVVVPFIFVGVTCTIKWILVKSNTKYIVFAVLISGLVYNLFDYNKTVLAMSSTFPYKKQNIDTSKIIEQLSIIEPDASVMTSGQLLWFFITRDKVYNAYVRFHDEVKYIVILKPYGENWHVWYSPFDRFLLKETNDPDSKYLKKFKEVSRSPYLVILKNRDYN